MGEAVGKGTARFALAVAALGAYVVAGVALVAVGVWSSADPGQQRVLTGITGGRLPILVVAVVLFLAGLGLIIARLATVYLVPLRRLAADTLLIASVNPAHRVDLRTPVELAELAAAVNELADRYQVAEQDAAGRAAAASAEVTGERNRLAALMSELTSAVIVCNVEGGILLYNTAARELLDPDQHGYVGLGRSVFGVVDRELVTQGLDLFRVGATPPWLGLAASRVDRPLGLRVAPVTTADGDMEGFVLTFAESACHHADLLPRAAAVPRQVPAGRASWLEAGSRPEFYDFELFRAADSFRAADNGAGAGVTSWRQCRLDRLTCTVFDTETTGLDPSGGDKIVSIGAVRIVNGRLLRQETYEQLVDPGRRCGASSRIHGITDEMLAGQPRIEAVLAGFARFADGSVLVGHNLAFDLKFLELEAAGTGVAFTHPVLDTLLLSPVVNPDHADHSLEAIAGRLGVSILGRHSALGDAILTGEIFLRLVTLLVARGVTTLGEAQDAARKTYHARVSDALY